MAVVDSGRRTSSGRTIWKSAPKPSSTRRTSSGSGGSSSSGSTIREQLVAQQKEKLLGGVATQQTRAGRKLSSSRSTITVTGGTKEGGTITVSRTGLVTERDKDGRLIKQFQADPNKARELVEEQAPQIEGSIKAQRERNKLAQAQETAKTQFIKDVGDAERRRQLEHIESQRALKGSQIQAPSSPSTTRDKIDTALFGFLPGGPTPKKVLSENIGTITAPMLIPAPLRKPLFSFVSKQVKKVVPSKESILEKQAEQFRKAEQLEAEGSLEVPTGFSALNPFDEQAQIGKTIIQSVKSGQTLEEFREEGKGQKGLDFALAGSETLRERPLESVELGSQIVFGGKGLATIGQKGITTGTGFLTKLGLTSRTAKFVLLEAPILFAESEAIGFATEKIAESRGFSETQSKNIAFVTRILQAEAFANVLGGSELARIPQITKPVGFSQKLLSAKLSFQAKVIPGFIEGLLSTEATFDRFGPQEVLGITFGDDKLLPSKEIIITPDINTLEDEGFKTITETVTRPEFEKRSSELAEKQFTREDIKDFENILFKVTDDGEVTEEALFSLNIEGTEETKLKAGKIVTRLTGGTIGAISAGSFGVFEDIFKGTRAGRSATAGIGYSVDLPELPGDVVTGAFTPFGPSAQTSAPFVPTASALTRIKADVKFSFKGGQDITFTKILDKVKGPFSNKKGQAPFSSSNFGTDTSKGAVKGFSEEAEMRFTKDLVKTQTKDLALLEGVRSLVPARVNIPTPIKTTSPTSLAQRSFDLTKVSTPVAVDVKEIVPIDVPVDVPVDVMTDVRTDVRTDVTSTVFTPKLFLFPPKIDFEEGFRRRGRRKKALKTNILALLPDFTSRAIGLKPQVFRSPREALVELRKIKTGFEIRRGGVIIRPTKQKRIKQPREDTLKKILKKISRTTQQPIKTPSININDLLPKLNLPKISTKTPNIEKNVMKNVNNILKGIRG